MKVVLLKDHNKTGSKGDVIEVKDGFGVNFLIPKGFAVPASEVAVQNARKVSEKREKSKADAVGFVEKLAARINKKTYRIPVKVSSGGRVYGSVGKSEILKSLKKMWKIGEREITIDLDLAQSVREAGKYPVDVVLSGGEEKAKVEVVLEIVGE